MESVSSSNFLESLRQSLWLFPGRLEVTASRVFDWVNDLRRQFACLPKNHELFRAILSTEDSPVYASRYRVGSRINLYSKNGEQRRFKVFGIRSSYVAHVYTVVDLDEMVPYCLKEGWDKPIGQGRKSVRTEAEISVRLGSHPNLVSTRGVFSAGGELVLLTDYYPSANLELEIRKAPIPLEKVLRWAIELCRALTYANTVLPGFVHGAVKPANCFIASDGTLKLGEFGKARADSVFGRSENVKSATGNEMQMTGPDSEDDRCVSAHEPADRGECGCKTDVFDFGLTLLEMLSAPKPSGSARTTVAVPVRGRSEEELEDLRGSGVPAELVDVVASCLQDPPELRPGFSSIEKALADLCENGFGVVVPDRPAIDRKKDEIVRLAASLAVLGHWQEAVQMLDEAIREYPDAPEFLVQKAISLLDAGLTDDAYFTSTDALRLRSELPEVLLAHGRVLSAKGDLANAERYVQRALRQFPDNCVALNLAGDLLQRLGWEGEALAHFDRSLRRDCSQPEPLEALAQLCLKKGRQRKAIRFAKMAVLCDPHRSGSHLLMGEALYSVNRYVEATESYKAALRSGNDTRLLVRRFVSSCCEVWRSSHDSITFSHVRLFFRSAELIGSEPCEETAKVFVDRFLDLLQTCDFNPRLLFFVDATLARLAGSVKKPDSARLLAALEIVRKRCEENRFLPAYALRSLGETLFVLGAVRESRFVFQSLSRRYGPDEKTFCYLAACLEIEGDIPRSLRYYNKAFRLGRASDVRTRIARVAAKLKTAPGI